MIGLPHIPDNTDFVAKSVMGCYALLFGKCY